MGCRSMMVADGRAARLPCRSEGPEACGVLSTGELKKGPVQLPCCSSHRNCYTTTGYLFTSRKEHGRFSKCIANTDGVDWRLDIAHQIVDCQRLKLIS